MGNFTKNPTSIDGVYIIEPKVFGDNRGYFMETYSKNDFDDIGLNYNFVQDNQSKSKWEGVKLSEENKKMFMIPRGFAHGFLVLSDEAEFTYKCDDVYNPKAEGGLAWNDKDVGIEWPFGDIKQEDLLTSEKDSKWPTLKELRNTDLFKNL